MARLADLIRGSGLTKFVYKAVQEFAVRAVAEPSVKEAGSKDQPVKDLMAKPSRCLEEPAPIDLQMSPCRSSVVEDKLKVGT